MSANIHLSGNNFAPDSDFSDESSSHDRRVRRLSAHKARTVAMLDYLGSVRHKFSAGQLRRYRWCHNYLLFRYYPQLQKTKLYDARHCDIHLVCPMCAIRRAAKTVQVYERKTESLLLQNPALRLYYVVLTVKNGHSLSSSFVHLESSLRLLIARRRHARSFVAGKSKASSYAANSVFASVSAGAYSFEAKRGKFSGLWHPHVNLLLLTDTPISQSAISKEWESITKDSCIVHCEQKSDTRKAFVEIFKYALKFSETSLSDNYEVWESLRTRRLSGSFGDFRGLNVDAEPDVDDAAFLEYVEIFYRYNGEFYQRCERVGSFLPEPDVEYPDVFPSASLDEVFAAICE